MLLFKKNTEMSTTQKKLRIFVEYISFWLFENRKHHLYSIFTDLMLFYVLLLHVCWIKRVSSYQTLIIINYCMYVLIKSNGIPLFKDLNLKINDVLFKNHKDARKAGRVTSSSRAKQSSMCKSRKQRSEESLSVRRFWWEKCKNTSVWSWSWTLRSCVGF